MQDPRSAGPPAVHALKARGDGAGGGAERSARAAVFHRRLCLQSQLHRPQPVEGAAGAVPG